MPVSRGPWSVARRSWLEELGRRSWFSE